MLKDKDIREPLFDFLEEQYGKTRIIEEKTMGKSRADVVMVLEEELVGIEIKSDADTYARLSRQVKDYDRFFDRNYVVAGSKHAHHVGEHVPEWWGIITVEEVDGVCDFYVLRKAEKKSQAEDASQNKIVVASGTGTYSGSESFAGIQAEKQRFCPQKNHGKSTGRPAA